MFIELLEGHVGAAAAYRHHRAGRAQVASIISLIFYIGDLFMNNEHMQFILEDTNPRVSAMEQGQITDCKDLFDPALWDAVPPSEHRYVFGRPISMLVAQGKIPLEFAGFSSSRHNLYRKIDK